MPSVVESHLTGSQHWPVFTTTHSTPVIIQSNAETSFRKTPSASRFYPKTVGDPQEFHTRERSLRRPAHPRSKKVGGVYRGGHLSARSQKAFARSQKNSHCRDQRHQSHRWQRRRGPLRVHQPFLQPKRVYPHCLQPSGVLCETEHPGWGGAHVRLRRFASRWEAGLPLWISPMQEIHLGDVSVRGARPIR